MATLALAVAGAAAGSALLPAGVSILGATLTGAAIGSQLGAFAGSYVDRALFGGSGQTRTVEGPRLASVHLTSSSEGSPIPRVYGRARLGGQVIWADDIVETVLTSTSSPGGGKGVGASAGPATRSIEYRYSASFAVGLCEGETGGLGRVWVDGRELDLSRLTYRLYTGSETQAPDSLIQARLGAGAAPAFRGTSYVVFQDLALADFGNRIPQLSFEVYRPVESFAQDIRGVVLIPGSGEFVYATTPVVQTFGGGRSTSENVHTLQGPTDWDVAVDQLQTTLPNAQAVSLIVSWFGTDLRAGNCQLKPGVERTAKETTPLAWGVAGVNRAGAYVVSAKDGRPAYGGTPSDQTVVSAIVDLKARGLDVIYTPFILMDVPDANGLPNPYGGTGQPVYPWRGRITVHPAPGQPGTPDKTAAAATQLNAFIGTALPSHYALSGTTVNYSGPVEWSLRRMVLHQAYLAKAAGGVTAFVIGSELRGLTQVRSSASAFPFVSALIALAADVKAVLGPTTKVLYAADWSEYFGHQPGDGTGDVYFHLDPLWASASIDAIGIDLYWPLADWRDGTAHADYVAGARSTHDLAYLKSNVQAGEGYDWYYASDAARTAQTRSPITDGAGKPWVFRFKDIKSWWTNQHFNRPGGIESGTPTAWVPQSKPFWFTEVGCPAIDKGANQPNVFVDPKSSESFIPYFSRGTRDDLIQRRYLQALIQTFDPASEGYIPGANPTSSVYNAPMVDLARILPYCWDARPFPAFPFNADVWGDGANWTFGHWLTGRLASGSLEKTIDQVLQDFGFTDFTIGTLGGTVPGFVIDRVMSARDALQALELAFFFDTVESNGKIAFRPRGTFPAVAVLDESELVEGKAGDPLLTLTRGQETDLPASAKISYIDAARDYQSAVAEARRLTGASGRVSQAELPMVLESAQAQQLAESWLYEAWAARERASFTLPPSQLAVEPGDALQIIRKGRTRLVRVTEIGDHGGREVESRTLDPSVYAGAPSPPRAPRPTPDVFAGQPLVTFLDLPLLRGDEPAEAGYVAATQGPWPGAIAVYGSPETSGFVLKGLVGSPVTMGTTVTSMPAGVVGVIDRATTVQVDVGTAQLSSVTPLQLYAGRNAAAVKNAGGEWEVFQFETATLISAGRYDLSGLLRGQVGSEHAMRSPLPAGSVFVALDNGVAQVDVTPDEVGLPLNWRCGPATRDIGDASYLAVAHTFRGVGSRPLAPAHVRGARAAGDLTVSWLRRTRSGGDNWESADVPLSETSERYEVDILDGAIVRRTLPVTSPLAIYTSAHQIADFGSSPATVSVRVVQVSDVYGRGIGKSAVV